MVCLVQAKVGEMETMCTVTIDTVYDDENASLRCLRCGPGLFSFVMIPFRPP